MIHLILATFESGQGFTIYDDKTISARTSDLGDECDSLDYYPRWIRALYDFAKELSKDKDFLIHKIDVGSYYLLLFDAGDALWGFFCDVWDNIPFTESKIVKIIKLLDITIRDADKTRPLKIDNSLHQQLAEILATQIFPQDKLDEIDELIQKLDNTSPPQVSITSVYLFDIDGGIVKAWEPVKDYTGEIRHTLYKLVCEMPFNFQSKLELNVDIGSNENEGWRIIRLGNTEFCMCFRVLYASEHRGLLNVITSSVCERILDIIGDDIQKASTELSHHPYVIQKSEFFDF